MKADDILGFKDLRQKTITIPEWGDKEITIQELGLEEGMAMYQMFQDAGKAKKTVTLSGSDIAQVVAWGVVDENGERVFSDKDVPKLARKNRDALMRIYTAISSLSGEGEAKN